MIGPWVGIGVWLSGDSDDLKRGLNAAMLWETPSARMNFSLNSILVRPFAVYRVIPQMNHNQSHRHWEFLFFIQINPQTKSIQKNTGEG